MLRTSIHIKARNKRELMTAMVDALMEVKNAIDSTEGEDVSTYQVHNEGSFNKGESPFAYELTISELEES